MTAQEDYVKESFNALKELPWVIDGDANARTDWMTKLDHASAEYDAARAIENDASRSASERKTAKDRADAVAKAAPAITKSVMSAVSAFKKGDAINGSADILDICASVASLVGSFTSAAGPAGALIGALFSVVSMILRAFGPRQESDVEKLQKFMKELQAQTKVTDLKAVHDDVMTYAASLMGLADSIQAMLSRPLETHRDFLAFDIEMEKALIVLDAKDPHRDASMFENWKAVEYLRAPENHDVPLWPAVLGVCCKVYSDMIISTMTIATIANTDDLLARLADVAPDSESKLSKEDRRTLEKSLTKIIAYAEARKLEYKSCNKFMLRKLKDLIPVAQGWGLYAHIGTKYSLYLATGPRKIKNGDWTDVSDRNYYHRLTLFAGAGATFQDDQASPDFNFKPDYHCFVLKSTSSSYPGSSHWVDHAWVNASDANFRDYRNVQDNFDPALEDIWVNDETETGLHAFAGTAQGTGAPGSVTAFRLDGKDNYGTASLTRDDWWPQTKSPITAVRSVVRPVAPAGDPHEAEIPIGWTGGILYAAMGGTSEIYINESNQSHYMPGPAGWTACTGIAVDQNYLWFSEKNGIAVISHASVRKYLRDGTPPRWIGWDKANPDLANGIVSFSPCPDGTIVVAGSPPDKEATIQMGQYEIDVARRTLQTQKWTKIPGAARQVQKLPMPGWNLLQSLMEKLA